MKNIKLALYVTGALLTPAVYSAEVPNTFSAGAPAFASEVNENFQALADAITALETQAETALTMDSVAGTYRVFTSEQSLEVVPGGQSSGSFGSGHFFGDFDMLLRADGTISLTGVTVEDRGEVSSSTPDGAGGNGVAITRNFETPDTSFSNPGTWSLSGQTISFTFTDGSNGEFVVTRDGNYLLSVVRDRRDSGEVRLSMTSGVRIAP